MLGVEGGSCPTPPSGLGEARCPQQAPTRDQAAALLRAGHRERPLAAAAKRAWSQELPASLQQGAEPRGSRATPNYLVALVISMSQKTVRFRLGMKDKILFVCKRQLQVACGVFFFNRQDLFVDYY